MKAIGNTLARARIGSPSKRPRQSTTNDPYLPTPSESTRPVAAEAEAATQPRLAFQQRLAERSRLRTVCPCGCADAAARRWSFL